MASLKALADGLVVAIRNIDTFSRWIANIPASLRNLGAAMQQAGRDIVDGLVRGFINANLAAVNAVRELGTNIMNTFKDTLGIRSPSRVFMGYGEMVAEGLALGIRRNTPEALRAALDMARQVAEITERQIVDSLTPKQERVFDIVQPAKGGLGNIMPTTGPVDNSGWIDAYKDAMAQAANDNGPMQDGFARTISDALRAAATGGDWQAVLKNKLFDIFDQGLTSLIDSLVNSLFSSFGGGGSGGGGGNWLTNAFAAVASTVTGAKTTTGKMMSPSIASSDFAGGQSTGAKVVNIYAEGYVAQETLRQMIGEAMVQTGTATHNATINTIQKRSVRSFAA